MLAGSYEKESEVVVRRSLEFIILTALHPNTAISVILQVTSDVYLKAFKSKSSVVHYGKFLQKSSVTCSSLGISKNICW
jgi:hypothetical protein